MHLLVELHGQPGWVAALTPLSVDGMIVAASTTLLADSRSGHRGGLLPWALLVAGSAASLAANVAVAEPSGTGRIIAAWPSFSLIAAYELLMRQVRRSTEAGTPGQRGQAGRSSAAAARAVGSDQCHDRKFSGSRRDRSAQGGRPGRLAGCVAVGSGQSGGGRFAALGRGDSAAVWPS
jgi:hypothetical protein